MKFLIINTDYIYFIKDHYQKNPDLHFRPYNEQYQIRMAELFGTSDFYSINVRKLGHEAWDVIANIEPLQKQWAREQGVNWENSRWRVRLRRGLVPWLYREHFNDWIYSILAAQIKAYQPDVLYSMAAETFGSDFLRSVKGYYRLAVVQHAAPLPTHDLSEYDLVLSSLPNLVDYFRQQGMRTELLRLGFEHSVLKSLSTGEKRFDIVFIGGLEKHHQQGTEVLERLCEIYNVKVWGYGIERLSRDSPIHKVYMGPAWGKEMYQVLNDAKIVFNRHIDIAEDCANNMRLYEATGVGTLLLTDFKRNLRDMFNPGKEVVSYHDADECVEQAGYYLTHEDEREAIARSGQIRTMSEHTWSRRMEEMIDIVRRYL